MAAPQLRFKEFDGEWNNFELGTLGYFINGLTYAPENIVEKGLLVLRSSNVQNGELAFEDNVFVDLNVDQEKLTQKNDILICVRNGSKSLIGKNALIKDLPCSATHGAFMTVFRSGLGEFVYQLLQTKRYYEYIYADLGATINSINGNNLKKYKFYLPEKKEQTKIASFLSAVDEKISQLTQKHELLSQYKQGMMQKLFSQQVRFKADDGSEFGEWENLKFKTFIEERSKICSNSEVELCSLTIEKGVTEKTERYTRDFLVKDESNAYKEVHFNDFVMNPMNLRFGAIAKSNIKKLVKISKYYNVFYINEDIVHLDYFTSFAISKPMIDFYNLMSTGSLIEKRRNHFKDFIEYEKLFPCLEEQTKIANFLSAIDQKIEVVSQQIEQAKQWKKGLLQQMFV